MTSSKFFFIEIEILSSAITARRKSQSLRSFRHEQINTPLHVGKLRTLIKFPTIYLLRHQRSSDNKQLVHKGTKFWDLKTNYHLHKGFMV